MTSAMPDTHLFLTLSRGGWGEAIFGLRLAEQLKKRGEQCVFLSHSKNLPLLSGSQFEFHEVGDHCGTLVKDLVVATTCERCVSSIVLCDFLTTDGVLRNFGIDGRFLRELGIPVVAVDTWDISSHPREIDIFMGKHLPIRDWINELPARLTPSPILTPTPMAGRCSFDTEPVLLKKRVREHVRRNIGLSSSEYAVLFCTAHWQQAAYNDSNGERIAEGFAALLAGYLARSHRSIHLVHVGPAALPILGTLGERYHWLAPLGPQFDYVLGASDLLLSANISATTVGRAIASGMPVLVLENSCSSATYEDAYCWLGTRATVAVSQWLPSVLPLYPFRLWPLGFYNFLSPVLNKNPYSDSVRRIEWLDENAFRESLESLLFENHAKWELKEKQEAFLLSLNALPSPADAMGDMLAEVSCEY